MVKESIDLASSLAEVSNVVDVTFKNDAQKIYEWSQTSLQSFGLTKLEAQKYNGVLGALLKSSGVSSDKLVEMSTNLTGLAGDFASFFDSSPEEAFNKIKSGISGETEPLKAWGINMSVANMEQFALTQGINKQWKAMSQSEQTLLRYSYLMKVSTDQQGDFARTSDSFANQLKLAQSNLKQLGGDLASYLLPGLNKVLLFFNSIINQVPVAITGIKNLFKQISKADSANEIIYLISENLNDLLFSLLPKKLANFLSESYELVFGFLSEIIDNIIRIAKDLSEPFFQAITAIYNFFADRIAEIANLFDFTESLQSTGLTFIFNNWKMELKLLLIVIKDVFNFFTNNWNLIEPIIVGITGAITAYNIAIKLTAIYTTTLTKVQKIWELTTKAITIATAVLNGTLAINPLVITVALIGSLIGLGVLLWKNWDIIKQKAQNLFSFFKNKFNNIILKIIEICNVIKQKTIIFKNSIIEIWENLKNSLINKVINIRNKLKEIWNNISETISTVVIKIWSKLKEIWNNISETISTVVINIWNKLKEIWNSIFETISTVVIKIWDCLVSTCLNRLNSIYRILLPFTRLFEAIFKGLLAITIIITYKIYKKIKTICIYIYSYVHNIFTKFSIFIKSIFISVYNIISSSLNRLKNVITIILGSIFIFFKSIFTAIYNKVASIFKYLKNIIVIILGSIFIFFKSIFTAIYNFLSSKFTAIYNKICSILESIFNYIKSIFTSVYNFISNMLTSILNWIINVWNNIYISISGFLKSIFCIIVNIWSSVYNYITSILTEVWSFITNTWNNIYTGVSNFVNQIFIGITTGFEMTKTGVVNIFTEIKNTILGIFESIWGGIKTILNTGIDMINGFISGVNVVIEKANNIPGVNIGIVSEIPHFAKGTNYSPNGWAMINEEGGELRRLSTGETIIPADKSDRLLKGKGINKDIIVNINIQGNVIANKEYLNETAEFITNRLKIALQNI